MKACSHASCALRYFLKPKEAISDVASATGPNARAYNACMALSYMVGIPNGRFFFLPGFSISTLRKGLGLYFLSDKLRAAFIFVFGVHHFSPSTPAVLLPLF